MGSFGGRLFAIWKGGGAFDFTPQIWFARFDGSAWSGAKTLAYLTTCKQVAFAEFNQVPYLLWSWGNDIVPHQFYCWSMDRRLKIWYTDLLTEPGFQPESPLPPQTVDTLSAGEYLTPGQELVSKNQKFRLIYQTDGNLVLSRNRDGEALWSSKTDRKSAWRFYMQSDGNLVVYERKGNVAWAVDIYDPQYTNSRLTMQDDGNLAAYDGNGLAYWSTETRAVSF